MIQINELLNLRNNDIYFVNSVNFIAKIITENKETFDYFLENYVIDDNSIMNNLSYEEQVILLVFTHFSFIINDSKSLSTKEVISKNISLLDRYLNALDQNPELQDYMIICRTWNYFWKNA